MEGKPPRGAVLVKHFRHKTPVWQTGPANIAPALLWKRFIWFVLLMAAAAEDWAKVPHPQGLPRMSAKTVFWSNGIAFSGQPIATCQFYDPEFEFLEVGAAVNEKATWKLYGPDASGTYGGMGGVGGLDAIAPPPDLFCPVVSDIRGNLQAIYDQRHGNLDWFKSRVTGYGAVPGYRPVPFASGQVPDLASSSAWRGCWQDITGYYWLGMRYYDPVSGRWMSDDSLGHEADPTLQTFCEGDPINRSDRDGRFGKKVVDYGGNAFMGFAEVWTGYDPGQPTTETGNYGRVGGRNAAGALASFLAIKGGGDTAAGVGMMLAAG
ncbi:MAG: hypothetical protein JWM16_3477 [Verrucomicrobiales bacterium]|nr:hypothetical protein [Verrucomicrobiales bacterium]